MLRLITYATPSRANFTPEQNKPAVPMYKVISIACMYFLSFCNCGALICNLEARSTSLSTWKQYPGEALFQKGWGLIQREGKHDFPRSGRHGYRSRNLIHSLYNLTRYLICNWNYLFGDWFTDLFVRHRKRSTNVRFMPASTGNGCDMCNKCCLQQCNEIHFKNVITVDDC